MVSSTPMPTAMQAIITVKPSSRMSSQPISPSMAAMGTRLGIMASRPMRTERNSRVMATSSTTRTSPMLWIWPLTRYLSMFMNSSDEPVSLAVTPGGNRPSRACSVWSMITRACWTPRVAPWKRVDRRRIWRSLSIMGSVVSGSTISSS